MDGQLKQLLGVDIQDEFIRLARIAANSSTLVPPVFNYGNLSKEEHDAPPKIAWSSPSGQFDPGKGTGGVKAPTPLGDPGLPPIGTLVPRVMLWIWGTDSQSCWDLFRLLVPAIRNKAGGPNSRYREYQEATEEQDHFLGIGSILTISIDFDLSLYGQVSNERALKACTGHTHVVSLAGPITTTVADSGSNPLP